MSKPLECARTLSRGRSQESKDSPVGCSASCVGRASRCLRQQVCAVCDSRLWSTQRAAPAIGVPTGARDISDGHGDVPFWAMQQAPVASSKR